MQEVILAVAEGRMPPKRPQLRAVANEALQPLVDLMEDCWAEVGGSSLWQDWRASHVSVRAQIKAPVGKGRPQCLMSALMRACLHKLPQPLSDVTKTCQVEMGHCKSVALSRQGLQVPDVPADCGD